MFSQNNTWYQIEKLFQSSCEARTEKGQQNNYRWPIASGPITKNQSTLGRGEKIGNLSISLPTRLPSVHYHNAMGAQSYNQIGAPIYVLYMYIFITRNTARVSFAKCYEYFCAVWFLWYLMGKGGGNTMNFSADKIDSFPYSVK